MTNDTRHERLDHKRAAVQRSAEAHQRGMDWALSVGFSERYAPFAGVVAEVLKAKRKRPITKAEVQAEMQREWGIG